MSNYNADFTMEIFFRLEMWDKMKNNGEKLGKHDCTKKKVLIVNYVDLINKYKYICVYINISIYSYIVLKIFLYNATLTRTFIYKWLLFQVNKILIYKMYT